MISLMRHHKTKRADIKKKRRKQSTKKKKGLNVKGPRVSNFKKRKKRKTPRKKFASTHERNKEIIKEASMEASKRIQSLFQIASGEKERKKLRWCPPQERTYRTSSDRHRLFEKKKKKGQSAIYSQ